jgi:hypothetical protein
MIFSFFGYSAFSQIPILTQLNTGPAPGDVFRSIHADTVGVSSGTAGANQIWDYSNLTYGTDEVVENYYQTDTNYSQPSTVLCMSGQYIWYLKVNQSEYSLLTDKTYIGGVPPNMGVPMLNYIDPLKILNYPFTFSDNFNDTVIGTEHVGYSVYYHRNGTSASTADGYGTLILPSGTYQNVLRIKNVQIFRDSISIIAFSTIERHIETYIWYDGIHKTPLLKIQYSAYTKNDTTHSSKSILVGEQLNGMQDGNNDRISFDIYPNPATDKTNLTLYFPSKTEAGIELVSITGNRTILIENGTFDAGKHSKTIDLKMLSRGQYIVRLKTPFVNIVKKIILN